MEAQGGARVPARLRRIVPVAIAVAAFVLGVVGYLQADTPTTTAIYDTFLLFALNYAPPNSNTLPVALDVARFLAPVVTLLAAAALGARLFRDEYDRITARFRRRQHVIVCGLGYVGSTTVQLLRRSARPVVAVERDSACATIPLARSGRVPVVVGDARAPHTLERAGLARATSVIWTAGDLVDGQNVATKTVADVLRRTRQRQRRRRPVDDVGRPPVCLVRVRDLGLCELLRREVLRRPLEEGDPDTDYFNEWENTAQRLLWDVLRGYKVTDGHVDIWLVGAGPLAEALMVQAVRNWWGLATPRPGSRLAIHLFDDGATAQRDRFAAAWPQAAEDCDLCVHDGPAELVLTYAHMRGNRPADAAFVLLESQDNALELAARLGDSEVAQRVAVAIPDSAAGSLRDGRFETFESLVVFDPVGFGLDTDILLLDTYELLARMIHERYLEKRLGDTGELEPDPDPDEVRHEWTELQPLWRNSNRAAARFVMQNLSESGFDIVRRATEETHFTGFGAETEKMAEREHERWVRFMIAQGFRYAPGPRNLANRTNPDLRPWTEIDQGSQDYTCEAVNDYPRLLAQLGYQVGRKNDDADDAEGARPG
ncbi:MAG TPA: NAD-binding protein [Acidimicrobiia bacterium]|nr:NAD-binding protein [Acidimicrobiia bacterium]